MNVLKWSVLSLLLSILLPMQAAADYTVKPVENGGLIKGRVSFKGEAPPRVKISIITDENICGEGYRNLQNLVLSNHGGMANAVVTLEGIDEGKPFARSVQLINQSECSFFPHIQVARKGQEFIILNSDSISHNIHGYLDGRSIFNLAQPIMGKRIPLVLNNAGKIEIKCDIHPWMHAWIHVAEHPYYSVSGPDGGFLINRIPPGTYRLVVHHEMMGDKEREVTVGPGQRLEIDFVYEFADE